MAEFKHSGNAGDIIYMLPTIAAVTHDGYLIENARGQYETTGAHVLYLNPNRPAQYAAGLHHPGGSVMLNEATCRMLIPLVQHLGIACKVWEGEEFDYDLDLFREARINLAAYDIRRWIMAVYPELRPGPALKFTRWAVEPDYITVNLSERYRNNAAGGMDKWKLLNDQPYRVVFIGVDSEYEAFKTHVPDAIKADTRDFLTMAKVICGGRMHFGNQSSPFAIAEIFDHPRALELSPYCPNVVSTGENWGVIYNSDNMVHYIDKLTNG